MYRLFGALLFAIFGAPVHSAEFPRQLTQKNIDRMVEVLGVPTTARLMRSAEAYPSAPGIKFGFDVAVFPSKDINELGDGSGNIPGINVVPRFFVAKGLFWNLEFIFEYLPAALLSQATTMGITLKWTFATERSGWISAALFVSMTSITGWDVYEGKNVEFGIVASRDYVKTKPYFGLGFLFANAEVDQVMMAAGETNTGGHGTLHFFTGIEFEGSYNFTAQLDFFSLSPGIIMMAGKRF